MQYLANKTSAGAGATITLSPPVDTGGPNVRPSGTGEQILVYSIDIRLINGTGTAVTGSAILAVTSANLGGLGFDCSNALAAWTDRVVTQHDYGTSPLKATPNTSPTIVLPTPGAGCYWQYNIGYDFAR